MTSLKTIGLLAATVSSFSIGFWLARSPASPTPAPEQPAFAPTAQTDAPYTVPSYYFQDPFSPREELNATLSLPNSVARYGRMIAIGYHAARENQLENLAKLSPEIWDYSNYDLRGAFHSEWMRASPNTFLPYAEAKYQELAEAKQETLFPSYHLSYMEPLALLDILPKIQHQQLKAQLCNNLLGTLIELDPSMLWEHKELIASNQAIIDEASSKTLYDLALQFWELSGWESITFDSELHAYLAQNQLLDYAAKLTGYEKTRFATEYALAHPADAAQWVREQSELLEFEYEFQAEHASFFRKLFATEKFSDWEYAAKWLCEGISADTDAENQSALFSTLKDSPQLCHLSSLQEEFSAYLFLVANPDAIKNLYLEIANDHPLLSLLEQFMLKAPADYSDAIVARTTRETPTPDRLMQVLEMGNLDAWPDAYYQAAKETLLSLSDEDLLWSLSPGMLLSAQQIATERIQNILSMADPSWLTNSLHHYEFASNASIQNLSSLPHLLQDLPQEEADSIMATARNHALRKSVFDPNKLAYLQFAQTQNETLIVAQSIELESYQKDPALKKAISENPHRDDIYLAIASNHLVSQTDTNDPNITQAFQRIETGRKLSRKPASEIVSTIQSLPSSERFITAKAVLMAQNQETGGSRSTPLIDLPIWSDTEREQLQVLGFTHLINYSIDYQTDFTW